MTESSKYYTNFREWYEDNMHPIFANVSNILSREIKKNGASLMFSDYWMVFVKNSMALFELLSSSNCSYQIAMTLRLLMEMSADAAFLDKYPQNIEKVQFHHKKVCDRFNRKNVLTYGELAKAGKNYHVFEYDESGNRAEKPATTQERLKGVGVYDKDDLLYYDYLNCFTHFNHLGMMYDLNLTKPTNVSSSADDRLTLLLMYPKIFRIMVSSLGGLCNSTTLKDYDCSKLRSVVLGLKLQAKTEDAHIVDPT